MKRESESPGRAMPPPMRRRRVPAHEPGSRELPRELPPDPVYAPKLNPLHPQTPFALSLAKQTRRNIDDIVQFVPPPGFIELEMANRHDRMLLEKLERELDVALKKQEAARARADLRSALIDQTRDYVPRLRALTRLLQAYAVHVHSNLGEMGTDEEHFVNVVRPEERDLLLAVADFLGYGNSPKGVIDMVRGMQGGGGADITGFGRDELVAQLETELNYLGQMVSAVRNTGPKLGLDITNLTGKALLDDATNRLAGGPVPGPIGPP